VSALLTKGEDLAMMTPGNVNAIILGASILVMCLGGYDVLREADPTSLGDFFEKLGEGLIGRLAGWWLIAVFILMLIHVI
jgi:hypothetical protein